MGLLSILTLLTLHQEFAGGALDIPSLQTADRLLRSVHAWALMLGPNFMLGINALMYGSLLYQTRLVPQTIAVIGLVGAVSVFSAALLEMFGIVLQISAWGAILAIPVALYELALAVWLIVKGFNPSAIVSESPTGN